MKFVFTLLTIFLISFAGQLNAQITPAEAVSQMGRGINLGNTLDPPTEGGLNTPPAKESYFDAYVEAGFKTVRITITWDKHTDSNAPYTIDASWLSRVEEIVDWGLNRDMFVIIDAHHEDWLKEDFGNPEVRERFDSIWSQISVHFKGKAEKLFFELLNEPRTHSHEGLTQVQIDDANERLIGIIRKDHPTRIVVYSGKGWTGPKDMMAAKVPDDPYIMATFHAYIPWSFAGESNGTWGSAADRSSTYSMFADIRSWADQNNVEVLLGEFGSMWDCDYNSKMLHYATNVRGCLENNIAFTVWDDDGWFQVLKRSNLTWQDSKDILMYTTLQSPDNLELSVVNDSSVLLGWTPGTEACDTIFIERRVNNGAFEHLAGVHADSISFLDSLTRPLNDYTYRVITHTDTIQNFSYPAKIFLELTVRKPFSGIPFSLPGVIEAEDYDYGGEGLAYHETTAENIPGKYRPKEGVDIEYRSGGFQIAYAVPSEWMEYSVDVTDAGTYEVTVPVASVDGGGMFRISFNGKTVATMTAPKTGNLTTTEDLSARFELEAGEQIMRVLIMKRPPFNLDKFIFSNVTTVEQPEMTGFRLYPNPAGDRLYMEMNQDLTGASVTIFSSAGLLVKQLELISPEAGLDVSELKSGLYLIRISGRQGILNRRFIKE